MSPLEAIERLRTWDGVSRLEVILQSRRRGPNFFHIAPRVLRVEGIHSDLLAWLLDPQGWHGLRESFVGPFIKEILHDAGIAVDRAFTNVVVDKEFSTGKGPLDVLVRGRLGETPIVVGIENKIDAPLGDHQLERYACGLVAQFHPEAVVVLVLLTPEEQDVEPPVVEGCKFRQTTYRQLVTHLKTSLSALDTAAGGAGVELARHYLEALRMHIVSEPQPEVDQILREMFNEHREAWREIRRRMPSERDEHHAALASALCERLGVTHGMPWLFALRRERYVRVFRSTWSALGVDETAPVIGLTDSEHGAAQYSRVHFRLTARPGEDDTDHWVYDARVRLDGRIEPRLGASLRADLVDNGHLKPGKLDRQQVTIELKQTSKLPGLNGDSVPDAVVEWYAKHLGPVISVLDRHLIKGSAKD